MDVYIGFDSAWANNPKAPGAICAVGIEDGKAVEWHAPELVSFDGALTFIKRVQCSTGVTLVALDQPTLVPNATSMRPVERVAASLVSWLGGGVQPSNTGRLGMFCAQSPIWSFLKALKATEDPEKAREESEGLFLMEVFPALALASFDDAFFGRLAAPKYNPGRKKTFRQKDWRSVSRAAAGAADGFGCTQLATWCEASATIEKPRKSDQDMLDAALCVLISLHWRLKPRQNSMLLGDFSSGYMVLPATTPVRLYLEDAAAKVRVAIDGKIAG